MKKWVKKCKMQLDYFSAAQCAHTGCVCCDVCSQNGQSGVKSESERKTCFHCPKRFQLPATKSGRKMICFICISCTFSAVVNMNEITFNKTFIY